jgi:hypothetical protein
MGRRDESDEAYVVGLCEQVLGEQAVTQHRFDWLLGDAGADGRRAGLPVDAYWPGHRLVVEYREAQHDRPTVSGVHRGEQRALYDARRDTEIPAHGLRLVVIRPADLDADSRGRLRRDPVPDLAAVRALLSPSSDEDRVAEAFRAWLRAQGWTLVTPADRWADIEAVRGGERLVGEIKGRTRDRGVDADIAYGQLLRRMTDGARRTRYALVVPSASVPAAERVPARVRELLRIDVYEVTDDDRVFPRPARCPQNRCP